MFHVMFHNPLIPPNTGNAIRMVAATGAALHLVEPLGFELSNAHLRRAGLDYHDLARVYVHPDFDAAVDFVAVHGTGRLFAFTGRAERSFSDVSYEQGDTLLFGTETTGLPDEVLGDTRITDAVRIPMLDQIRSLNLSNSAAVAAYEGWRQHGYATMPEGWLPPQGLMPR
ncbi:tRNA (cytidine(34)-2'-O)-methyltransferase [Microbacterium sp.]|uniref:tRNA (cytidine(34)-2'-O)-methyltransferase n=1 Tax=Microbacterium sp. TaxID=51671 RepID=UPI003A91334F